MADVEQRGGARAGGAPAPARALVALAAAAAALHVWTLRAAGPVDDDFIVHRYARNVLEGHGPAFNAGGEAAEGFTSPLWLGASMLAQALGLEPASGVSWVLVVGLGAAACAALLTARAVSAGAGRGVGAAFALAVALSPALAFHAAAGLGTLLLAVALVAALALWRAAARAGRRPTGAGLALGCACLVRQEAALFWLPFAAVEVRRVGLRAAAPAVLPGAVGLLVWSAARLVLFGRLEPVTYAVKKLPLAADLGYGLEYLGAATLDAAMLPLVLVALAAACDRRLDAPTRALGAGVVLHGAFVVLVGGDWMLLARFFVPALPVAAAVAGIACARWLGPRGALACGALLLGLLQVGQRQRAQVLGEHEFFERRWAELGDHFGAHAAPGARVALSPVGLFGWRSRLPIVDLLGLTHTRLLGVAPDLEGVRLKGHHRHDAGWVLADPPEFMVLGNGVLQPDTGRLAINPWERDLVTDPRFAALYVQVRADVAGAPAEWFRRRDVAPFPGETPR